MLPPGFSPFPADAIAELQTQRLPWPPVIQRYMVLVYRSSCIIQQSSFIVCFGRHQNPIKCYQSVNIQFAASMSAAKKIHENNGKGFSKTSENFNGKRLPSTPGHSLTSIRCFREAWGFKVWDPMAWELTSDQNDWRSQPPKGTKSDLKFGKDLKFW